MIDGVVRNEEATGHHIGENGFVTLGVDFLLSVKKAEGHISIVGKMVKGVAMDKVHDIADTCHIERAACQRGLLIKNLECCDLPTKKPARQCKPQSGVARTRADLDVSSCGGGCRKQGDELAGVRWNLAKALESGRAVHPVTSVDVLKLVHTVKDASWYVVKHVSSQSPTTAFMRVAKRRLERLVEAFFVR